MAAAAIEAGRNDEALARADRVLEVSPRNVDALNVRASALLQAGDAAGALPLFEEVLRQRPGSSDATLNLSSALLRLARFDDAVRVIDAVKRTDFGADLYYNRGAALLGRGDALGAVRDFESSLRLNPDPATQAALEAARKSLPPR